MYAVDEPAAILPAADPPAPALRRQEAHMPQRPDIEAATNALQEAALLVNYLRVTLLDDIADLRKLQLALERAVAALAAGGAR